MKTSIIEFNSFSHANYLIIDIEKMEVERFEPHGAYPPVGYNYSPELLDTIISNYPFQNLISAISFIFIFMFFYLFLKLFSIISLIFH